MITLAIFLVAAGVSVTLLVIELHKHRQRTFGRDAPVLDLPVDRQPGPSFEDEPPAA